MQQPNDRSSKWIIEHFGGAILRLAGVTDFISWQPITNEQVAPRRTPDGLLQVQHSNRPTPTLYLIEIETYPSRDIARQVFEDIQIVYLNQQVIPEVILLVLKPRGQIQVSDRLELSSPSGTVKTQASWPVTCLWNLRAADLLAMNDVGLIPWVALCQHDLQPQDLIQRCRERIDALASSEQDRNALLSVTQILASSVYNNELLMNLLGGSKVMIESPALEKMKEIFLQMGEEKGTIKGEAIGIREIILEELTERFGIVSAEIHALLESHTSVSTLKDFYRLAKRCSDLEEFEHRLKIDHQSEISNS